MTSTGQVLGGIIAFLGILIFALPIGILGSAFVEETNDRKAKKKLARKGYTDEEIEMMMKFGSVDVKTDEALFKCPHCDGPIPNVTQTENEVDVEPDAETNS